MNSMYADGTYLESNPDWHAADSPWKAQQIAAMFRKNGLSPARVCEVGCGAGEIVRTLAQELPETHFVGYEISPQAYEICRDKGAANVEFRFGDYLSSESEAFDVTLAIDVIEHIEDCFSALRTLQKKPGKKVFHIPLEISAQAAARNIVYSTRKHFGHLHYFNKDTALETLERTGYTILDWNYTRWAIEYQGRGWKSFALKVPRAALYKVLPDLAPKLLGGFSLLVLAE
ncbi:MAG: class I SAM-dependent methyltransferase [Pirellulales bacterium]